MEYEQSHFLEMKQVKAYTLNSLFGNIGGYIGMFLGYALLNAPTLLTSMIEIFLKNLSDVFKT